MRHGGGLVVIEALFIGARRGQVNRPARPGGKRRGGRSGFNAELCSTVQSKQQLAARECCPDHSKLVARPWWY